MGKQHKTLPGEKPEFEQPKETPEIAQPSDPKEPEVPQEDPQIMQTNTRLLWVKF
ncbi:hypothetical protein [Mucilaginibacter jinjuensis]|uniref:Uncharacterized protein n=1 Tax=Mucilaginibacter jinjuensis TaxID=1176721 RepID=A0ABY7TBH1_9SPHI|nr:hypothetical protein [Mucilaginibacter jinjuensis]WCT13420.1 hypothetical protein PQO05_05665 [Mucilaginibacter jinjuensis]